MKMEIDATDEEGEELDPSTQNVATALAVAWNYDANELVLSCVCCDWEDFKY